jgi:membrane associated rhomboid family serine protease
MSGNTKLDRVRWIVVAVAIWIVVAFLAIAVFGLLSDALGWASWTRKLFGVSVGFVLVTIALDRYHERWDS